MDTKRIDPVFMKALVKCHRLHKEARKKVFHNRRVLMQMLKVFKWQRRIRHKILSSNNQVQERKVATKKESITDLDIVRRNLWLVIVRKDIVQAHKRKMTLKEHKLVKSRSVAQRCRSYLKEFHDRVARQANLEVNEQHMGKQASSNSYGYEF